MQREDHKTSLSLDEGRGWSLPRTPIRGEGEKAVVRPYVASGLAPDVKDNYTSRILHKHNVVSICGSYWFCYGMNSKPRSREVDHDG